MDIVQVLAADVNGANILDLYGSNGRCQITVAEDELDDIKDDPIRRKIYKVGYDLTGKIPRTLDGNTSNRSNRLYEVFGFKIFGTEVALDDKILEGFNDRIFRIESIKGKPYRRVKKVLLEMEKPLEKQDPKYREIIKEVDNVRKITFIFRMLHHEDMIEEVETNIDGRPLELTAPQIYLFASKKLGSSYALSSTKDDKQNSLLIKEILPTLSIFLKRKGQLAEKTIQNVVYEALSRLVNQAPEERLIHRIDTDISTTKTTEVLEVAYDLIYDEVRELTEGRDPINSNEQAFYSVEYGKITHRQILSICKNPFRGQKSRIKRDNIQAKSMIFDKKIVRTVGEGLKAITNIEILDGEPGTEVLNLGSYREKGKNDDSYQEKQPDQQEPKVNDIHDNEGDNSKKQQDIMDENVNNIEVENDSNTSIDSDDKTSVYTSTTRNSVPSVPRKQKQ